MEPTISLRALLSEYREAKARLDEAEAAFKLQDKADDRQRMAWEIAGMPVPDGWVEAQNAKLDEYTTTYCIPVDHIVRRMRAAVCILHGVDPYRFDRPLAVLVDGTILTVTDKEEDATMLGLTIVEPGDVTTIVEDGPRPECVGQIERFHPPRSVQEATRAVFQLLEDHWSINGGWSINAHGGSTSIEFTEDVCCDIVVSEWGVEPKPARRRKAKAKG